MRHSATFLSEEADTIEEDYVLDLVDELRPASLGIFPQSRGELREMFDPDGDCSSDYLLENY